MKMQEEKDEGHKKQLLWGCDRQGQKQRSVGRGLIRLPFPPRTFGPGPRNTVPVGVLQDESTATTTGKNCWQFTFLQ